MKLQFLKMVVLESPISMKYNKIVHRQTYRNTLTIFVIWQGFYIDIT